DIGPIGQDKNWKGIGISLLVIVLVLSLIGLSIILLSKDDLGKNTGSQLTLDDLFQRNFQIHEPDAKWISGKIQEIMNNTSITTFHDGIFLLFKSSLVVQLLVLANDQFAYKQKRAFIKTEEKREVRELNPPEVSDSVLQFASWGVHGQQLIYIFENNIYYQTHVQSSSWRLTSSGQEGIIFNGITDWLYEEQVLHTQVAHWWSPDGSRLAYLTINNSLVPNMLLPSFTGSLYPRGKEYPYPKMGQINPTARLYVVIVSSTLTTELRPPDSFEKSDSAPGGQAVSDRFSLGWDTVLVSSDSIIVARLDGRGSGFQGQRILHEVHRKLGTVDLQDQIAALKHLIRLPYIDGNKIGVYGKAYGGFLSSLLLLSYSSMFRCGIAVAPITNWSLFGSAYAERYLGSPAKADQKYQIFPDEGHNIASDKTKHYMLNTVLTFFKRCFAEEQVVVQGTSKEDD
ncbi:Inactive dipeptidyl peptidase 10, partial [Nibea albiflora]